MYGFYYASCMNIIFNELRQQRVKYDVYKYDVHTTSKIKHTRHIMSHIIFIANLSVILIGTILQCAAIQSDRRELAYAVMTKAF